MKLKNIISSFVIISLIIVVALLILGTFIFNMTACGCGSDKHVPAIKVDRVNATTINMTIVDLGGASSVKGLKITMPTIANQEVVSQNVEFVFNQTIAITDPNLTKPAHLVVISWVDNSEQVVVDTEI